MIIGASGARPSRTADLERKLVHHCSPALAGLKPANMFVYREGADAGENPDGSAALSALDSTKFAHDLGICRKKLEPCLYERQRRAKLVRRIAGELPLRVK